MNGIVNWYDSVQSLGFIIGEDGLEYFFRKKDVAANKGVFPGLCCLDKVEFSPRKKEKSSDQEVAIKITKIEAYKHGQ